MPTSCFGAQSLNRLFTTVCKYFYGRVFAFRDPIAIGHSLYSVMVVTKHL